MFMNLTVGYVAGFIAAGIFVARLWSPNVLTFILSGILKNSNSAATWTAVSSAFQRSHWAAVLQSDSARNHGVRKDVLFLTWGISIMGVIIAVAGVVTPLGLYEKLVATDSVQAQFQYIEDMSPFGFGTPPRSNYSLNRFCESRIGNRGYAYLAPCPFTDTVLITQNNDTDGIYKYPYGYNTSIPQRLVEIYSSGTEEGSTISNYQDIEWRRYQTTSDTTKMLNNGSTYLVGAVRMMRSQVLNDNVQPVEGLLIDSKDGGIGFRNHTIPTGFAHGVTWQEDLLFVEPETVCVDTNTTIDFEVSMSPNSSVVYSNLVLTDRGGFVNMEKVYPLIDLSDTQKNPKLAERAYKAAFMANAYTMFFYNISNPTNETLGTKAWSYMNSEVGKRFHINNQGSIGGYDSLTLDNKYTSHLDLTNIFSTNANVSGLPGPTNPFLLTQENFTSIGLICSGVGDGDYSNITNIYVGCGLFRGIPRRTNPGSRIIFDAGSTWSQPIYTCASAVKATIKTVHLRYNGTTDDLKNLVVDKVEAKTYDNTSLPLWAMEDTGNRFLVNYHKMIWGLLSDKYEHYPNVSTVRQSSLYLPGSGSTAGTFAAMRLSEQNTPASEFYAGAMGSTYNMDTTASISSTAGDYTGLSSMALWAKWQNMSQDVASIAKIPGLIFTDYAAASVVGTKSVLGPKNAGKPDPVSIWVTPTQARIHYRLPFAIPAIIALLGLILMTLAAFMTMIFRHHNIHNMRLQLQTLSPGRMFTVFLHPQLGGMSVPSRDWSRNAGCIEIDASGDYPYAVSKPAQYSSGRQEKMDKGVESHGTEVSSERDADTEREQFLKASKPLGSPQPYTGSTVPPAQGEQRY